VKKKWADALIAKIEKLTGSTQFTYVTAVTKLRGDASVWQEHKPFRDNLHGNPIKILTLQEMLSDLYKKTNTTVASSEVGRLLQVIKASGWNRRTQRLFLRQDSPSARDALANASAPVLMGLFSLASPVDHRQRRSK